MDGWGTDAEMALHIGFGGRAAEHASIGMNEGQILALLFREMRFWDRSVLVR
jgi:hypothetical protein